MGSYPPKFYKYLQFGPLLFQFAPTLGPPHFDFPHLCQLIDDYYLKFAPQIKKSEYTPDFKCRTNQPNNLT